MNENSASYGMNVKGPIFVTELQSRIMNILHKDPELNNRTIGIRIGSTRSAVQTAIVCLYQRTGAKTRQELIAHYALMMMKDGRGGNRHPIAAAHKRGKAFAE